MSNLWDKGSHNNNKNQILIQLQILWHRDVSLQDDADVENQQRSLCVVGNMVEFFYRSSPDV